MVLPLLGDVGELDLVLPGAIEDDLPRGVRDLPEGLAQLELVVARESRDLAGAPVRRSRFQDRDRAVLDRLLRGDDDAVRVGLEDRSETRALGTGAVGRVEGEEPGRDLRQGRAAIGARVVGGQDLLRAVRDREDHEAPGDPRGRLDRVGQPLAVVLVFRPAWRRAGPRRARSCASSAVQLRRVVEVHELPVDARAEEALLEHLRHLLLVLALLARHVGSQDEEAAPHREPQGAVHHLLDRLGLDRAAARGTVRLPHGGIEQAQVVVDLGHGADGRARVARRRPLLDRDRRGEPLDRVHVRLLHLLEELPRIRGQGLDVAALPFREDRVEGERRLARSRDPRDHHQAVAGDVAGDVPEVVLARAADPEEVHGGKGF